MERREFPASNEYELCGTRLRQLHSRLKKNKELLRDYDNVIKDQVASKINLSTNLMAPNLNFTAATSTIALTLLHLAGEELDHFITCVNSCHPALKYTWEISETFS